MAEIEKQISRAEANLERQLEWVSRHDGKVNFVFALDTALFGALAAVLDPVPSWSALQGVCAALAVVFLGASLVPIIITTVPRTTAPTASLIFFGEVGKLDPAQYSQRWRDQSDESYLEDLLAQCHVNSKILVSKFENLKISYAALFVGLPFWSLSVYLFN